MEALTIVEALGGKRSGNSWSCRCPAHEDRHPSLSVSDGDDGRVLVHCHAGCPQGAVIDALRGMGLWSTGSDENPVTPEHFRKARRSTAKRELEAKQAEKAAKGTVRALRFWKTCFPIDPNHSYLKAKQIKPPFGIKQRGSHLIIPAYNRGGKLQTYQQIDCQGAKRFMYQGVVDGCYFPIDGDRSTIVLCEGFATGCSLSEHWGFGVAVAFNCGNLIKVAMLLFQEYPEKRFIAAADDDSWTKNNPGLLKADAIRREVDLSFRVVTPDWGDLPRQKVHTDFNDYFVLRGAK